MKIQKVKKRTTFGHINKRQKKKSIKLHKSNIIKERNSDKNWKNCKMQKKAKNKAKN